MKHQEYTLSTIIHKTLHDKKIEPIKRIKCLRHVPRGLRNLPEQPRYISHQYPIKDGITHLDILAENISQNNALLSKLVNRGIF